MAPEKILPTTEEKSRIAAQLETLLDVHLWHQERDERFWFIKLPRTTIIKAYQRVIADLK